MSDLFHEKVTDEQIAAVFGVMAACPQHTFQVLTKRPERMRGWFRWIEKFPHIDGTGAIGGPTNAMWDALSKFPGTLPGIDPDDEGISLGRAVHRDWPLPNVLLGVSIEDQATADERIPILLETPAAVHWIAAEPLLGPVDLDLPRCDTHDREFVGAGDVCTECDADGYSGELSYGHWLDACADADQPGISWVVCGGESGPNARPCDIEWIRSIVRQCREAGVPPHVKQAGSNVRDRNDAGFVGDGDDAWAVGDDAVEHNPDGYVDECQGASVRVRLRSRKGSDPSEWPSDIRVQEFPQEVSS